jgi:hypothetical protein
MKVFLKIFILFLPFLFFSQDLKLEKLLLTKKYVKKVVARDVVYSTNFAKNIFNTQNNDSIFKYSSSTIENIVSIDKKDGNCIVLNFNKNDFNNTIDKLDILLKEQYNFFKDENQNDYKDYLTFINRGLIIVTIPKRNQIILVYMNTCIFKDSKQKIIKNIICDISFDKSYVFSCGGKGIFQKISPAPARILSGGK